MSRLYYRDPGTELYVGDARTVLATLPASSVDCVVTSPPQWGLRDYGTAQWTGGNPHCDHTLGTTPHQRRHTKKRGLAPAAPLIQKRCRTCGAFCDDQQYGLESTVGDYVNKLQLVGREIWRILHPGGTFWLNLRDSYSYHNNGTGSRRKPHAAEPGNPHAGLVRHKSLFGIPWRVALSLQNDGWIIRNAIVWHKPNAIPDPASDRLSSRYELLFLLVKQPDYHFNIHAVHAPYSPERPVWRKTHYGGTKLHTITTPWRPDADGKNLGDLWSLSTRPLPQAHPAPFPVDLPHRCITAGSPEKGRVLDPFSGAGTTGIATHHLGGHYQGIDLRADYHDLFLRRRAAPEHEQAQPA